MARILTSSDCSLCVEFGDAISEEINRQVRSFTLAVEAARIPGIVELVPTYRSVTVHYRPEVMGYARMYEKLTKSCPICGRRTSRPPERYGCPCCTEENGARI